MSADSICLPLWKTGEKKKDRSQLNCKHHRTGPLFSKVQITKCIQKASMPRKKQQLQYINQTM